MEINRKRVARRIVSGLVAGAVALGGLAISGGSVSAKTPSSPSTNRYAGDDRYETAVEIARTYSSLGTNGLVVASGESPYDALAASALAGSVGAPIVLVKSDSLPESVADLLDDNKLNFFGSTKTVYVVGGTSVISDDVVDAIKAIIQTGDATPITVSRLAGADRYKTAALVNAEAGVMNAGDRLVLVNGSDGKWADALSVAAIAAKNGWPVVLTNNGINADALGTIKAYLALAGSVKQFLIVGGPAVMPLSIEETLVGLNVAPATIDRRGGLDRYQTNLLLNLYSLTSSYATLGAEGKGSAFDGSKVALVSGEAPWDALAAGPWAATNTVHVALTNSASLNPQAAALAGALSFVSNPGTLYVIGGKNAVSSAARDAFVAGAKSTDITTGVSMSCAPADNEVYLTFPSAVEYVSPLDGATKIAFGTAEGGNTATIGKLFALNGVKDSVTGFIDTVSNSAITLGSGSKAYTELLITLDANLRSGDKVEFLGVTETGTNAIANINRNIAGASCTAADTAKPTASVKFVVKASALDSTKNVFDYALVTLSEPISQKNLASGGFTAGTAVTDSTATLAALSSWVDTAGSQIFTAAASATLSAYPISSKLWKVSLSAASLAYSDVTISATGVSLKKEAIVDLVGNGAANDSSAAPAKDATAPTSSVTSTTCTGVSKASMSRGGLTLTAAARGVAANSWKLTVVNSRGLIWPSIAIDSTAKTVTVTIDQGYHTGADIATAAANAGQKAPWVFSGTATAVTATLTDVTVLAANLGYQSCASVVSFSEPVSVTAATATVTVANVASTTGKCDAAVGCGDTGTRNALDSAALGTGSYSALTGVTTSYLVRYHTPYSDSLSATGVTATDLSGNVSGAMTVTGVIS